MHPLRMVLVLSATAALAGGMAPRAAAEATNAPPKLTVRELLAQKQRWQSNRVEVSGYYVGHFEVSAIYASEADAHRAEDSRSLWVWPWQRGVAPAIRPGDSLWVRAVGVLRVPQRGGCGHFGQWPAELAEVELMEPLPQGGRTPEGGSPDTAARQTGRAPVAIATDAKTQVATGSMWLRVVSGELTLAVQEATHEWRARAVLTNGCFELKLPWDEFPAWAGEVAASGEVALPVRAIQALSAAGQPWSIKANDIPWTVLQAEQHPDITYRLTGVVCKLGPAVEGAGAEVEAKGTLVIGGATNVLAVPVKLARVNGKRFKAKTAFTLRLSDFKLTSPQTTGLGLPPDEVRVAVECLLERDQSPGK